MQTGRLVTRYMSNHRVGSMKLGVQFHCCCFMLFILNQLCCCSDKPCKNISALILFFSFSVYENPNVSQHAMHLQRSKSVFSVSFKANCVFFRHWEAIKKWDEAIQLTPDNPLLYEMKSQVYHSYILL